VSFRTVRDYTYTYQSDRVYFYIYSQLCDDSDVSVFPVEELV